ncbi:hypothetical protein RFI_24329 [Reticulomyxa filosa]|uniref:Uncharacterized protein n=1 Tax=Reticulomyxa filosa TaxID=46433 RepID=X6MIZ9_RETFI|nr:hypothetical protein RFI_24329 [Reticulomyxa filosa]|eukprot:ETO13045.1 hypothetical protein RFI_24329 [Reticulomyxa filosa]
MFKIFAEYSNIITVINIIILSNNVYYFPKILQIRKYFKTIVIWKNFTVVYKLNFFLRRLKNYHVESISISMIHDILLEKKRGKKNISNKSINKNVQEKSKAKAEQNQKKELYKNNKKKKLKGVKDIKAREGRETIFFLLKKEKRERTQISIDTTKMIFQKKKKKKSKNKIKQLETKLNLVIKRQKIQDPRMV